MPLSALISFYSIFFFSRFLSFFLAFYFSFFSFLFISLFFDFFDVFHFLFKFSEEKSFFFLFSCISFKYVLLLALVSEFNCFLRSRCSMEMWCPDDTGRDSWGWVGPPTWERACFNSPEWGWRLLACQNGASPDCIVVVVPHRASSEMQRPRNWLSHRCTRAESVTLVLVRTQQRPERRSRASPRELQVDTNCSKGARPLPLSGHRSRSKRFGAGSLPLEPNKPWKPFDHDHPEAHPPDELGLVCQTLFTAPKPQKQNDQLESGRPSSTR